MNATIIILKEKNHPVIPSSIKVRTLGNETIIDDNGNVNAAGTSILLQGTQKDIISYLQLIGKPVWTTKNPMVGDWELKEVTK